MSQASSPCIGVCTIDEPSALCLGCGRTIDEIVGWGALSEPRRASVMAELPDRLASRRGPVSVAGRAEPHSTLAREEPDRWTGAS